MDSFRVILVTRMASATVTISVSQFFLTCVTHLVDFIIRYSQIHSSLSLHSGMRLSDSLSSFSSSSSLSPSTIDESSLVPTVEVIHHTTPKISPLSGISRAGGGLDPDYIVIPTSSGTNPGGEEEDDGNRTTLKFTTGDGGM